MKKLATLALAVILITGCNAMKPNIEETELLSKEIEKKIYAQALPAKVPEPVKAAAKSKVTAPTPAPIIVNKQDDEFQPTLPEPAEEAKPAAPKPAEESKEISRWQAESAETIDWPYPRITCPPEPEWPYITYPLEPEWSCIAAPEPPIYTPEPESTEPPEEEPAPTPQPTPTAPADPIGPAPEPTPQPATPTPEPPAEPPSGGYAECSCGARLIPAEVLPHMKSHTMNGESHSYRAY